MESETWWVVKSPLGNCLLLDTYNDDPEECFKDFADNSDESIEDLVGAGYRCVKIEVKEVG